MAKTLLLDIDHTLMDMNTPRPYLKEFLERMDERFVIRFYTAASFSRVTEVCRVLYHDLQMDRNLIWNLQRYSLHRGNCPMINHRTENGGVIEIKCFQQASEILKVPIHDLMLLDDNPSFDNPYAHQIIQAEGFMAWDKDEDDYLNRLDITEADFVGEPQIE